MSSWFDSSHIDKAMFHDNRQGALADGLHGLNPRNTAHRHTPVQNATSVGLATGMSQGHGGTRPCE